MTKKTILFISPSEHCQKGLIDTFNKNGYTLLFSENEEEGLKVLSSKKPNLIFVPLLLGSTHGISILKKTRNMPGGEKIGVVITKGKALIQDYNVAINCGANYYLAKPCTPDLALALAEQFFDKGLKPAPFPDIIPSYAEGKPFIPIPEKKSSYIKFWGTRGSIPVSGLDYYNYGGNTSCLEIHDEDNIIIIDAGTGIRPLGNEILSHPQTKHLHLLISHTHWDHIIGFPFFTPVYIPGYTIDIHAPRGFGKNVEELFTGMLDHDYFPVRLDEMQSTFNFNVLSETQVLKIGNIEIFNTYAIHPGATLCFKIKSPKHTIGYCTDNEILVGYQGHPNDIDIDHPDLQPYKYLIDFYKDCDIIIHEAQYSPEEYKNKIGWGHSSITNAMILMQHLNAKEWIITHHDPSHNDKALSEKLWLHHQLAQTCGLKTSIHMAYDGLILPL
jgi:phosphoribosyl 1,2-cyclic phosphodiesterase/ActR/RegA family two-component response regulator